jgi:monovalent cation:H+ antiporter-2, CPA2 family
LVEPVRHIFGALFFVSVGMLIDPQLLLKYWPALLLLTGVVIVGKVVSVSLASLLIGERLNIALKAGLAMAQIGVFAILLGRVASSGGAPSSFLYSLAVGVCSITAFLCPLLIRASGPLGVWIERYLDKPTPIVLSQDDVSRSASPSAEQN